MFWWHQLDETLTWPRPSFNSQVPAYLSSSIFFFPLTPTWNIWTYLNSPNSGEYSMPWCHCIFSILCLLWEPSQTIPLNLRPGVTSSKPSLITCPSPQRLLSWAGSHPRCPCAVHSASPLEGVTQWGLLDPSAYPEPISWCPKKLRVWGTLKQWNKKIKMYTGK